MPNIVGEVTILDSMAASRARVDIVLVIYQWLNLQI